ncbi:MAG TPA: TetR/AcrR family transcriptional regulator [Candidatus Saccharimonadales bacterium]|nr:TetR/AcrR family transcriptional regulator [Candidatus Saccharimonadales bacterium]
MDKTHSKTRLRILKVALKRFAYAGYAGVSVQDIVDDAKVTKPTLYYYFHSKAGLYQALVDRAHEERYRLMSTAAATAQTFRDQLVAILAAFFEFLPKNRDLLRLSFATAFAAPGEVPEQIDYLKKGMTHFEFLKGLIQKEMSAGNLNPGFNSIELAMGFYGIMNVYVMGSLINPKAPIHNRRTAEKIVELYLNGAGKP